ncbi:MAG: WecB/TagA/CpsF family glycosyltransferase [Muribaculaceae bacterium]|jgi:exopolysaccharide biosynthesis WecB/TagA/CpsF family protein|nr:WecB/TagA/CpsF family glycosyltransferase [Muribaculaceae bacterium]
MENKPATTIRILNADILDITRDELLRRLDRGVLVTPNVDHLVKLQSDPEFLRIYRQAEWVVCDSKIIQIMSRMLRRPFPEAIPGSSFFTAFYRYHKDDPDCRIFLLGAAEGVALKAMDNINRAMGRDIVVGAHSPSFGFEKNDEECRGITEIINRSGATVVLVGVGAPKQEKWIDRWKEQMPGVRLWMALGATIDFEAGTLQRAPMAFRKIGMEWFYRFVKEPRRLFRRYFIDDMKFFIYFTRQLLGSYKDPFA